MKVEIRSSFKKDFDKIKHKKTLIKIKNIIIQMQKSSDITNLRHIKKMIGTNKYYRIRIGDYRIGFRLNGDTVILLKVLARKDFYKSFP